MLWINFLHLYQPVNTDGHIIREATEMSYKRIVRALKENPRTKFTMNINGSLLMRWEDLGYTDLIKDIRLLIERGQVELVGTACYHPLVPLVPEEEAKRQIKENEGLLHRNFGKDIKLKGFFFPEMAYTKSAGRLVASLGYEWLILDEISHSARLGTIETDRAYQDQDSGLTIIFRSRKISNSFVPKTIRKYLDSDNTIISATDGELYGLRHIDHTAEFEALLKEKSLTTATVSDFIASSFNREACILQESNWESSEEELRQEKPFVLWQDRDNAIHNKLWELADLAYKTSIKYEKDENSYWSRWHLVRGLASCTFWWASGKDFSHIFGPHAWNPDEIERGMNEFIRSIRAIENIASRQTKMKAEMLFIDLKRMIWEKHWRSEWKKGE
jgi:predicted glycosyl hydrolase (DUF1957 family)